MSCQMLDGIKVCEETVHGFPVSRTHVMTARAAESIGRAVGEYVVIRTGRLCRLETPFPASDCLAFYLRKYGYPFKSARK